MYRPFALAALLLATSLPAMAQPAADPPPPGRRPDAARLFNELDTNRDGRLTLDEMWARTQSRFAAADANRDGALTPEEFRMLRPGRDGGTRANRDSDTPAAPDAAPPTGRSAEQMQRFADARFRALDANRDGRVTLDEMRPMVEARFRAMDANADNAVTQEEMPRWGRGHRGPRQG